MSLVHGAKSERVLSPIAEALVGELHESAPWTAIPAFASSVEAWAWAEARCQCYRAWFDARGLVDEAGAPLPGLAEWDRAEGRAARFRQALGLDPASLSLLLARASPRVGKLVGEEDLLAQLEAAGAAVLAAEARAIEG